MPLSRYYEGLAKYFLGENGRFGHFGVNRSEIKKIISEQNKISSEQNKISSELFALISGPKNMMSKIPHNTDE